MTPSPPQIPGISKTPAKTPGIIVALDYPSLDGVGDVIKELAPYAAGFKVGMELCSAVGGPAAIRFVRERGGLVFYDKKFGDISNTVKGAVAALAKQGVWLANVHASFDIESLVEAAKNKGDMKVVAVTILTSMKEDRCQRLYGRSIAEMTQILAEDASGAGLDGVVCRPDLVPSVKSDCRDGFITVNPGIRPAWAESNDQSKPVTPLDAARFGCDYFVLGRPVTKPPGGMSRVEAIQRVLEEMRGGAQ